MLAGRSPPASSRPTVPAPPRRAAVMAVNNPPSEALGRRRAGPAASIQAPLAATMRPSGVARAAGSLSASSEPKGQELTYSARISLDHAQMQIDDNMVKLSPGMAVTAEIKTASRRIISYLFSPLIQYRQESLRER